MPVVHTPPSSATRHCQMFPMRIKLLVVENQCSRSNRLPFRVVHENNRPNYSHKHCDLDFNKVLYNISPIIPMDKTEKCGLNYKNIRRLHIYLAVRSKGFDCWIYSKETGLLNLYYIELFFSYTGMSNRLYFLHHQMNVSHYLKCNLKKNSRGV